MFWHCGCIVGVGEYKLRREIAYLALNCSRRVLAQLIELLDFAQIGLEQKVKANLVNGAWSFRLLLLATTTATAHTRIRQIHTTTAVTVE